MKAIKIFGILAMMLLLVTTLVSAKLSDEEKFSEGLVITLNDWDTHIVNTNLTLHSHIYDARTGVLLGIDEANCTIDIHKLTDFGYEHLFEMNNLYKGEMTLSSTLFNETGSYNFDLSCFDVDTEARGGFVSIDYDVVEDDIEIGVFGLWKPVDNWTFPIVYLIITFILIMFAVAYESSILGVLGSIMLIMSYFIVGATSPILFTPLLIVGFLMAFKFATL
jgi:hypothetical protein